MMCEYNESCISFTFLKKVKVSETLKMLKLNGFYLFKSIQLKLGIYCNLKNLNLFNVDSFIIELFVVIECEKIKT